MEFDPVTVCGADEWPYFGRTIALWIVPVVLFALTRQVPRAARQADLLRIALVLASGYAFAMSLPWFDVVEKSNLAYWLAIAYAAWISAMAVSAVYVRRMLLARRRSGAPHALVRG
jgi:hypothetical protein